MPGSKPYRLRLPHEVIDLVRHMHPALKAAVRASLEGVMCDPYCGKLLKDELDGLRSLRVKRMRIIYRLSPEKQIDIVAIGPRRCIYEETLRILTRGGSNP